MQVVCINNRIATEDSRLSPSPNAEDAATNRKEYKHMPETLITVDLEESPHTNDKIHNRWHPDIPIVEWVEPGADFIVEASRCLATRAGT